MKVYEMHPNLYTRGRLPRSWTRNVLLAELKKLGVTLVVTLTPEGEPELYPLPDWLRVLWQPLSDAKGAFRNDSRVVQGVIDQVVHEVRQGGTALVMCRAGQNRAQLVTAGALTKLDNWAVWEAITHVRMMRNNALANPRFVEWLEENYA